MIISATKKFIFIHIPKTGGMSIRNKLQRYATVGVWQHNQYPVKGQTNKNLSKHAKALTLRAYVGTKEWNSYFSFAFVRNPWDWFVSVYHYIRKDRKDPRHKKAHELEFGSFLQWFLGQSPHKYPILRGQRDYLCDGKGNLIINFFGKLERMPIDFRKICYIIKVNCTGLGHENKTDHRHYRNYYNTLSKRAIQKCFQKDIDSFRYTF